MKTLVKRRVLAAVATCSIVAASLTGCSFSTGNATCEFKPHHPHQSTGTPTHMDGKATLVCKGDTSDIDWVEGTTKLQRLANGKWVDVANSAASRRIDTVKNGTKYTIMSSKSTRCVAGTYRTAAKGQGKMAGVSAKSMSWQYSGSEKITCKK